MTAPRSAARTSKRTRKQTLNGLLAADLEMFAKFKVTPELLREAGIARLSDSQARELGFRSKGNCAGLIFPYLTKAGALKNARLRRDHPELDSATGKPVAKYLSMAGAPRLLYSLASQMELLQHSDAPILIVESEKAVLAAAAAARRAGTQLLVLGLGGCWGWRGRIDSNSGADSETAPLPDLDVCRNRDVTICLDANVTTNPNVIEAEKALAAHLSIEKEAQIHIARLPQVEGVNGHGRLYWLQPATRRSGRF